MWFVGSTNIFTFTVDILGQDFEHLLAFSKTNTILSNKHNFWGDFVALYYFRVSDWLLMSISTDQSGCSIPEFDQSEDRD